MSVADTLNRRVGPRVLVTLSTVDRHRRAASATRRTLGGHGRVELYLAFDDPYSAVALPGLADRLATRRVNLVVRPVVTRGIPGDPAVAAKRSYAIGDARRLARRPDHREANELSRDEPIAAEETAFLARWGAAARETERTAFCVAAMHDLWFASTGPVQEARYQELWRAIVGGEPPAGGAEQVRRNERRMRRRKLYDTPAAVVHGQWFFAHERLAQIEHRLDELGWRATA
jgi:2-hydroxychromene-2-carboxylate isomerase